jgi:hypothetical protein
MNKTFAIYRDTPDGLLRIGTWTHKGKGRSVRELSTAFYERHPDADGQHYIAHRWWLMGRWTDGELLPLDKEDA